MDETEEKTNGDLPMKPTYKEMLAEARNAALDEAIEAITFEAEGRKKQMDAHKHDAVQHERFRIGELQSRLNVKNVAALKTETTEVTSKDKKAFIKELFGEDLLVKVSVVENEDTKDEY